MLEARNDAVYANHPFPADIHITERGSDWYYTVTAVMGLSALVMAAMSARVPRIDRIFYYIIIPVLITSAIAYYSMGSNLGYVPINVEFLRSNPKVAGISRQIFYARYIDWFITTPLLLLGLFLLAGFHWSHILYVIFFDWVMVICGLLGALTRTAYKWGYFSIAGVAYLFICWEIIWAGRKTANAIGADVGRLYLNLAGLTLLVWSLYPVCWGLSEGGNVIAPDSEAVFYGVLDLLSKLVFGFWLLFGHRKFGMERLGLAGRPRAGASVA